MNQGFLAQLKGKKSFIALAGFCAAALVMILIGVLGIHTPVVAMCTLVILEAGIAVMLHKAELWVHAVLILAEIIAGILAGRVWVIILCVVTYVAAIAVLQVSDKEENGENYG